MSFAKNGKSPQEREEDCFKGQVEAPKLRQAMRSEYIGAAGKQEVREYWQGFENISVESKLCYSTNIVCGSLVDQIVYSNYVYYMSSPVTSG